MHVKNFLFFLYLIFGVTSVSFADNSNIHEEQSVLLIEKNQNEVNRSSETLEFQVTEELLAGESKFNFTYPELEKLFASQDVTQDSKLLRIPILPQKLETLNLLSNLSNDEINLFLDKKNNFFAKTYKVLNFLKIPRALMQRIFNSLNEQFYTNHKKFINSNLGRTQITFAVSLGVGFPDKILNHLKSNFPRIKWPSQIGFYWMFGAGLGIRYSTINNKKSFSIGPVLEFRRGEKYFSPFAYTSAGINIQQLWSSDIDQIFDLEKTEFVKFSSLGTMNSERSFGVVTGGGIVLPPGGSVVAGIRGKGILLEIKKQLISSFYDHLKARFSQKKCSRLFEFNEL